MTSQSVAAQSATFLRALGLLERSFYRYGERNPLLFVLAAEFDIALDAHLVGDALQVVQNRHPLLSAHIQDEPETGPAFHRTDPVAPVELTFHREPDQDWQAFAAEELIRPFDPAAAPLMRATLLTQGMTSTLLLTFDHVIADGISSVLVLNDVLAALDGEPLVTLPVPNSLEELATRSFDFPHIDDAMTSVDDPRMAVPTYIRPFDATRPHLHRVAMSREATAHLVGRCRDERTTMHAAIVTAASRVRSAECGEEFIRTNSPMNVRKLIGAGDGCCLWISPACTGMAAADATAFWSAARDVGSQLRIVRSLAGLAFASAVIEQQMPMSADCDAAERFLCTVLPFEQTITNLGVQHFALFRPVRPRAIWGPITLTQVDRESVTGVVTYDGRLRMVTCGYDATAGFLEGVREVLMDAVTYPQ